MLDWIKGLSSVENFNILKSIRRTLINGIIKYNNDIKPLECELNFRSLSEDILLYMAIDGDNLTSTAIPYYKNILKSDFSGKLFISAYFGLGAIPYYITPFENLYKTLGKYYVSSYVGKKEAADVDMSYNIFNAFFLKGDIQYVVISNDRASVEITELVLDNDEGKCTWIDPFPGGDRSGDYLNWYPFDILSKDKVYFMVIDSSLPSIRQDSKFSYGISFIEIIKQFGSINVDNLYLQSVNILRDENMNTFVDFFNNVINSLFFSKFDKFDIFSQYLVLTGSRFFTYKELRPIFKLQLDYINTRRNFLKILAGQDLKQFLDLPVDDNILDVYKVFNMKELLYFNIRDFQIVFDIGDVEILPGVLEIKSISLQAWI
jgi:hypothetical protein